MIAERNLRLSNSKPVRPPNLFFRAFGGLKVRQKLVILHNLFFLVLAVAVYGSIIPVFSRQIAAAREREFLMVSEIFSAAGYQGESRTKDNKTIYHLQEGSADNVKLPGAGRLYLNSHPDSSWRLGRDTLIRSGTQPGLYARIDFPAGVYDSTLRRAQISLFAVLGTIYVLTIIVLEFMILPQYVYQPLTLMLEADTATQGDDREHELIDERFIMNDEIGQIMRSRNATVAQLRREEDGLASALKQLEEQDRLVSLGLLSTSVAHELNTPLAVLQGSIEKLAETTRDAQTLERLARMLRVTQRLRKISEGLVDFARVRQQITEPVALRPLIDESWSLVAIDEKASTVAFANEVRPADTVLGNADRLVQVFVNLLRNSLLAVSSGGEIRVESKTFSRNNHLWVGCTFLDDGPGIPSNILPDLFEAFVTTRLDARGTGLGLTVAEGIVTQHGGTISASNRSSGGASLQVVLPAATS